MWKIFTMKIIKYWWADLQVYKNENIFIVHGLKKLIKMPILPKAIQNYMISKSKHQWYYLQNLKKQSKSLYGIVETQYSQSDAEEREKKSSWIHHNAWSQIIL